MNTRTLSLVTAALLIGAGAVAFTTTVAGQAFEHQADATQAATAYAVDWQQEAADTLRLQFDPTNQAEDPRATVSLFSPADERLGTHTLDADWPQLDLLIQEPGEHTLVIHETDGANVQILTPQDADVEVSEVQLDRERVTLIEGQHEHLAYQMGLERQETTLHLGVLFEGQATNLTAEVLDEQDEPILEASAPHLVAQEPTRLQADLAPGELTTQELLVRLTAERLNGTVTLEIVNLPDDEPEPIKVTTTEDDNSQETEEDNGTAANGTEANQTEASGSTPVAGVEVAILEPGQPVAFEVIDDEQVAYLIGEQGAYATLYGPEDQVVETAEIDRDHPAAIEWEHDGDRMYAIPVDVATQGEHVAVLADSDHGLLFLAGADQAPDHRVLDIEAIEVEWQSQDSERSLVALESEVSQGNATVPGGLIGFSFDTRATDTDRQVRLYGPDGGQVAEADSGPFNGFYHEVCPEGAFHAAGPLGDYSVEMESQSVGWTGNTTVSLVHYIR